MTLNITNRLLQLLLWELFSTNKLAPVVDKKNEKTSKKTTDNKQKIPWPSDNKEKRYSGRFLKKLPFLAYCKAAASCGENSSNRGSRDGTKTTKNQNNIRNANANNKNIKNDKNNIENNIENNIKNKDYKPINVVRVKNKINIFNKKNCCKNNGGLEVSLKQYIHALARELEEKNTQSYK